MARRVLRSLVRDVQVHEYICKHLYSCVFTLVFNIHTAYTRLYV